MVDFKNVRDNYEKTKVERRPVKKRVIKLAKLLKMVEGGVLPDKYKYGDVNNKETLIKRIVLDGEKAVLYYDMEMYNKDLGQ